MGCWSQYTYTQYYIIYCLHLLGKAAKKLNVGNTLKDISNFLSWILESRYAKVLIFCENNAGEEKRSDEYCLFIIEVCHNEGGWKPSTSEPTRLIMYNKHSHWHKISLLGVLPERKNKPSGSTPRVSNGSNISRLYIMSSLLPMYNFWLFGSTPGSAIPFLW